jgi:hypothetical protein
MSKPYSEIVTQAENAVAAVKDAELRRVAFERVLNDLLAGEHGTSGHPMAGASRSKAKGSTAPPRKAKRRGGPQAHVEELVEDGFFKKPKTISAVKAELENRGHHIPLTSLSGPLQKLCQTKALRRQKADGKTFSYSNW